LDEETFFNFNKHVTSTIQKCRHGAFFWKVQQQQPLNLNGKKE